MAKPAYGWGPGYGLGGRKTHKPKAKPQNIAGQPIWGGAGQIGAGHPTAAYTAAAQAPKPQAIPADPAFEAQQLSNGRNLQVGNVAATWQNANTTYDTGYNASGQRDYTNPYNQAALLDESYKRSQTGTTNSYASQGQLHSGAYGRMQNENARNYSIGSSQLQTAAARAYQSTSLGQLGNIANYGTANDSGAFDAILKALGYK